MQLHAADTWLCIAPVGKPGWRRGRPDSFCWRTPPSLGGAPRVGTPCISDSAFGLPDWLETKCNAATIPTCKKSENFKALHLFYQGCYCQITSIQGWSDIGSVISDFSFRELRIVAGVEDSRVVATSKIQLPKMRQPWLDTSNTAYRMLFLPQYVVAYHRHLLGIDAQSQWRPEGFDAINPRGAVSHKGKGHAHSNVSQVDHGSYWSLLITWSKED